MTREEIKNTPEIVDFMLSESVMSESRKKLLKRLDEICNLAIQALEQEPKTDVLDKIRAEMQFYSNSFVLAGRNDLASAVSYCIEIIDKYGGEG